MKNRGHYHQGQRGAVLIVSLILLLIMTILAASNMRSTSMELRMATNNQSRQQAFQIAETALRIVEADLATTIPPLSQLQACAVDSSTCFEANCEGGLCFAGEYLASDDEIDCDPYPSSGVVTPVWTDDTLDVWDTSSRHQTLAISGFDVDPKYITEFLCYVDDGSGEFDPAHISHDVNAGFPVFRITALATSEDGKAKVMLQSTIKVED